MWRRLGWGSSPSRGTAECPGHENDFAGSSSFSPKVGNPREYGNTQFAESAPLANPTPAGIGFHVSLTLFGTLADLVEAEASLLVFDDHGTLLIEHPWPKPGTKYVRSGRPRGPQGPRRTS